MTQSKDLRLHLPLLLPLLLQLLLPLLLPLPLPLLAPLIHHPRRDLHLPMPVLPKTKGPEPKPGPSSQHQPTAVEEAESP
jgi:hypothetical protein